MFAERNREEIIEAHCNLPPALTPGEHFCNRKSSIEAVHAICRCHNLCTIDYWRLSLSLIYVFLLTHHSWLTSFRDMNAI